MKRQNVVVLGSTGSIGSQTLDVISNNIDRFRVLSLAAKSNYKLLSKQIKDLNPERISIGDTNLANQLRNDFPNVTVLCGEDSLCFLASDIHADIVVNAITGADGLLPSYCALESGKRLCTANKESIVMAGSILTKLSKEKSNPIIPIDSEHSALLQAMLSGRKNEISRLIITASGGPFFGKSIDLNKVTPDDALKHPTWRMGKRISIDSATMINKALEVIEAHWLFDIPKEKIHVLIHPESIVHSIVEFIDGSQIAQMSLPNMKLPIQYSLTYPNRFPSSVKQLKLEEIGKLTFYPVEESKSCGIRLGYRALELNGTAPAILNASDEIAIQAFLDGKIKFPEITELIEECLESITVKPINTLDDVFDAESCAREWMKRKLGIK